MPAMRKLKIAPPAYTGKPAAGSIFKLEPLRISATVIPGAATRVPCTGIDAICFAISASLLVGPVLGAVPPPKSVKKPLLIIVGSATANPRIQIPHIA